MSTATRLGLAVALTVVTGCILPADQRPGLWLRGKLVEAALLDWSFTDTHREIAIEIHTPYLVAHSVTICCARISSAATGGWLLSILSALIAPIRFVHLFSSLPLVGYLIPPGLRLLPLLLLPSPLLIVLLPPPDFHSPARPHLLLKAAPAG